MKPVTLVELCAGTAALTLHLAGRTPPVPTIGSKRHYASQIAALMGLGESTGVLPDHVVLVEPGEWGKTLAVLLVDPAGPEAVAATLEDWVKHDERELFDSLRAYPPSHDPYFRAATHLYLQTRTFRGKPVGPDARGYTWETHGFDSEYRAAVSEGSKDRGWFNARPVLAAKVRAFNEPLPFTVEVLNIDARSVAPITNAKVYIDPPYVGTIPYLHSFPRADVEATARRWAGEGCTVAISEAEALPELVDDGWTTAELKPYRTSRQLGVVREWVTYRHGHGHG